MFFRRLQSYKNLFLADAGQTGMDETNAHPEASEALQIYSLIMGSETVNAVPFPNSVSKIIVPL